MTTLQAAREAYQPRGRLPRDPGARWAFSLLLVSAWAAAGSLFFPWWELRSEFGGTIVTTTLWNGQWCQTLPKQGTQCVSYTDPLLASVFPAGLVSSLFVLEVLQVVAVIAFALAFATFALPRLRARSLGVPAGAGMLGIGLAWAAVVYAWFAIPDTEPGPLLNPATGFTGEQGSWGSSYSGYAWGAGNAWFLLFLAGGTGLLALLALRSAVGSARRSRTVSSSVR